MAWLAIQPPSAGNAALWQPANNTAKLSWRRMQLKAG